MPSSLSLVSRGGITFAAASSGVVCTSMQRRMCAPCQHALTQWRAGLCIFGWLSTRWKCTPYTTSRSKDHGPRTGSCLRSPGASWGQRHGTIGGDKHWSCHHRILELTSTSSYVNCLATARSMTNSIFRTWLWVKQYHDGFNCGRNAVPKSCAGPRVAVFRRGIPRDDTSSWTELDHKQALWWPQNWKNGLLHSLPRRQPSSRKEEQDWQNVNWWQLPLIQGLEPSEAQEARPFGRPSPVLRTASSSQRHRALI